jgi:hypothetical protein
MVQRRRLYVKDDAPVPVGTTRRPMVRPVESVARRDAVTGPRLEIGQVVVRRSAEPPVETLQRRAGAIRVPASRTCGRILEAGTVNPDR